MTAGSADSGCVPQTEQVLQIKLKSFKRERDLITALIVSVLKSNNTTKVSAGLWFYKHFKADIMAMTKNKIHQSIELVCMSSIVMD